MGGKSPTQRSLEWLREQGYQVTVVEQYNHWSKKRHDLFGFADLLAFNDFETQLIQVTTQANAAARRKKIGENNTAHEWKMDDACQRKVLVHAWGWKQRPRRYELNRYSYLGDGEWETL